MTISAYTFLFNADADGIPSFYGSVFNLAFLRALSAADPPGQTWSRVLRGDAILWTLCGQVNAVSSESNERGTSTQGTTYGHDLDLYRTVIWDLTDALEEQWHTVDLEVFPMMLGRHNVHCITVPSLDSDLSSQMDTSLRGTPGYFGAFEIDLGNPIQAKIFVDQLIDDAVIKDGELLMELSWEGDPDTHFSGAEEFKPRGTRRLPYGELAASKPSEPEHHDISQRGLLSLERYEGKRSYSVESRVFRALSMFSVRSQPDFEFKVTGARSSEGLEADLPAAKFVKYLLNPDHPDGGPKAKFFFEVLGIGTQDWRYLASQLYDGLKRAELSDIKIKQWEGGLGVSFNCFLAIKGLNGTTASVLTNWIMEPGSAPRFSTAYPESPSESHTQAASEKVADRSLNGDLRWARIYELADQSGKLAAEQCIPTPMKVEGFRVEMEGLCGFAWVRVLDARKGFARWALHARVAHHHYKSGVEFSGSHPSQSVDRAKAYAEAFAEVLRLNGIECSVNSRLD